MGKICQQFEAETPADSEATQKARFETVLDLMQQVRPPSVFCLLVVSTWVFGGGGIWEGGHTVKPRWMREPNRGHIPQSSGESIATMAQILLLLYCLLEFFSVLPFFFLILQLQDLGHPPKELAGEMVSISSPRF